VHRLLQQEQVPLPAQEQVPLLELQQGPGLLPEQVPLFRCFLPLPPQPHMPRRLQRYYIFSFLYLLNQFLKLIFAAS
jgi:hypothetical protein